MKRRLRIKGKFRKFIKKLHFPKKLARALVLGLVALIAVILGFLYVNAFDRTFTVDEQAMEPTFTMNSTVRLNKVSYVIGSPKRFDTVAVKLSNSKNARIYIRRVAGLPGERIKISDGKIYINDKEVEYPVPDSYIADGGRASEEYIIPEGEYFLIGDNFEKSTDSRSISFGCVKKNQIYAKVR
ncbi:MAG: signal peptidase I [Lachnospiraceae bacterium]|nr:signal peptidase I [Lachnospiraceae bacterium]